MKLNLESLNNRKSWEDISVTLPSYDIEEIRKASNENPRWVHFGIGNIFRIFIAGIADTLINKNNDSPCISCVECFDIDLVDKIYKPYDNLSLGVTLKADGKSEKRIIASLSEAIKGTPLFKEDFNRLKEIFKNRDLQMVSYTITEKGYALKGIDGGFFPFIIKDLENGPDNPGSAMAVTASMLYERYKAGKYPITLVSMDNCSHNGEKLGNAVKTIVKEWTRRELVEEDFLKYVEDESLVSFPWSMIDKITPRPSEIIKDELESLGIEDMEAIITKKNTYIAPFVNAEGPQYLVIEDHFTNGRPEFEKAGVYMTDRETVNKVERMKVTTCLNPLHTALAVYGCILSYNLIADEMKDKDLVKMIECIGFKEGMPVVTNPEIIDPKEFLREVIEERLPNPFMPDTPQRIATDTSQKVAIRFGETIKSYIKMKGDAKDLKAIPLAIAGWLRYLLAVDDDGRKFECSPDPMLLELQDKLKNIEIGKTKNCGEELREILSNDRIFGINLYEAGIGETIEEMFLEEIEGPGAVRRCLNRYL